ncbi:MAG: hypothetical protein II864_03085 [Prevotella sp.]|nr:hypothetical protein [Prevotella sp.]
MINGLKWVCHTSTWKGEPTPDATLRQKAGALAQKAVGFIQKAPGFEQKAPGFEQKAPGFEQKAPGFGQAVSWGKMPPIDFNKLSASPSP